MSASTITAAEATETGSLRRALTAWPTLAVLGVVAIVHGVNLSGWPAFLNDDEGTYMARAWAVQTGLGAHGGPAPYTYWYDHPPFGWMQLALWTWLTGTFRAGTHAVVSGRMAMLVVVVVTTALIYVLARRLGASRWAGWLAMALFGLSPLALAYTRLVMLDSFGLPWIVGAFVLALSPRRSLLAYAGAGVLFAGAILSKETYLLLLPALLLTIWLHVPARARRISLATFGATAAAIGAVYLLFAVLKGELIPGTGHVSLIGAVQWQLAQRAGSGYVWQSGTDSYDKVSGWLALDPWLLGAATAMTPLGIAVRRLRGVTAAFLTFVIVALRPGYLPFSLVTGALPWAALLAACGVDVVVRDVPNAVVAARSRLSSAKLMRTLGAGTDDIGASDVSSGRKPYRSALTAGTRLVASYRATIAAVAVMVGVFMIPSWWTTDAHAMTTRSNTAFSQAEAWATSYIPKTAVVVTDDNMWTDLVDAGFAPNRVIWFWELDQDSDVKRRYPGGWRQVGWVIATPSVQANVAGSPTAIPGVVDALAHSRLVVRFGSGATAIEIRRVIPAGVTQPPWWLPGYGTMRPPVSGPEAGERLWSGHGLK